MESRHEEEAALTRGKGSHDDERGVDDTGGILGFLLSGGKRNGGEGQASKPPHSTSFDAPTVDPRTLEMILCVRSQLDDICKHLQMLDAAAHRPRREGAPHTGALIFDA